MLRALKKNLKKLGSSSKLHEAGAGGEPAPAAPPRPQGLSTLPPGLPRPPSAQGGPLSSQQQGPPSFAAAAAAEGSGRPAGAPADAAASQPLNGQSGGLVDYELVAGPLEFDAAEAAAEAGSGETSPHLPGELCYGSGEPAGALELAAAEEEAAAAAAEEGIASHSAAEGGGGGGTAAGAAGGEPEITDALATMMYLTEDAEGNDNCVSVVSGAAQPRPGRRLDTSLAAPLRSAAAVPAPRAARRHPAWPRPPACTCRRHQRRQGLSRRHL